MQKHFYQCPIDLSDDSQVLVHILGDRASLETQKSTKK
jgi:hypothetical protein